jgi:hypothetical protein
MKTHLLEVRNKFSNRLHLKAWFETKIAANEAAFAILRANPNRYSIEISSLSFS